MAGTGPVKSHTIISYFYAYNILCFIRFTYLIDSGKEKQNSLRNKRSLLPETYIYFICLCCYLGFFFVVVHDLDLDLHEKINRNKRTRLVIIFFSHLQSKQWWSIKRINNSDIKTTIDNSVSRRNTNRRILTPISVSLFSFLSFTLFFPRQAKYVYIRPCFD
jgi:hypothetical protein